MAHAGQYRAQREQADALRDHQDLGSEDAEAQERHRERGDSRAPAAGAKRASRRQTTGHTERATGRAGDALRAHYARWDFDKIALNHQVFAISACRHAWAHMLAAVLAAGLSRSYHTDQVANSVAEMAFGGSVATEHTPFEELCALVEEVDGVRFRELVDMFNTEGLAGESLVNWALSEVDKHFGVLLDRWQPFAEQVVASLDDPVAVDALLENEPKQSVVDVVRRIQAGERDPDRLAGVDATTCGVVIQILKRINPELLRAGS